MSRDGRTHLTERQVPSSLVDGLLGSKLELEQEGWMNRVGRIATLLALALLPASD